ncbi:Por secretion system C-terminal sorting domain-containing protein [Bizionia echini]|uniref:Por secretion system C-terminal sorting domain-containing protein n=1 Tax=Bizionia echini TaxID=649333 RepID=A0A1I5BDX7_9FLAO|nr:T9SS type A sorting domain-containing protein [Bizionia echini]SFN72892.1 Por secretion system C-terminal sorting domain-containing protein [Bizionia echini]
MNITTLNKLLLFLTVALFFQLPLFSQDKNCGTIETPESLRFFQNNKQQLLEIEETFLNNPQFRASNPITSVPVKAHIIRTSSGTGGLTTTELNDAITTMNAFYANANLEFFICDGINYIDNDTYYDFQDDQEGILTATHSVSGLINIYFANTVTKVSTGSSLCGYAYYPGGDDTILMVNSCATNGSTLAHEMGHFFNLRHTHGGTPNELVNGSNCTTEGDYICDTPADPTLSYSNVNSSCNYTGTDVDANGDFYMPQTNNIMSYSRKECRDLFTPQQYARMYATYALTRNNFNCASISVDFTADITQSCQSSLTVAFSETTVGATSWAWDFDGDNITDYTTQNPTHTYLSSGLYDVKLSVSNAQNTISKSYTEYIKVGATETLPLSRDFDALTDITENGWTVKSNSTANFTWVLNSGTTPSTGSGPLTDASGTGNYIFVEGSNAVSGEVAEYITPCVEINTVNGVLEFDYHMFGLSMGELHVDIDTGSGFTNDITPAIIGQQQETNGEAYLTRQVDLSSYSGQTARFRFRAIRGSNWSSDIAIDNITIQNTLSRETFNSESVSIFPNPVSNTNLRVKLPNNTQETTYQITNMLGQKLTSGTFTEIIDVSDLSAGTYFLLIHVNGNKVTKRFIKK